MMLLMNQKAYIELSQTYTGEFLLKQVMTTSR